MGIYRQLEAIAGGSDYFRLADEPGLSAVSIMRTGALVRDPGRQSELLDG